MVPDQEDPASSARRIDVSRRGRAPLFRVLACVLVIVAAELFSAVGLFIVEGAWPSPLAMEALREALIARPVAAGLNPDPRNLAPGYRVAHPYLGFALNPEHESAPHRAYRGIPISEHGFIDDGPAVVSRSDDEVVLGVFGGSVAFFVSIDGLEALAAELRKSPALANKKLRVVRVTQGAYKQPQQLLALNYLLALGAHFDVVVNLDGFNEVALPRVENEPRGVHPSFPVFWAQLARAGLDPAEQERVCRAGELQRERRELAESFSTAVLRYSFTWNLLWRYQDLELHRELLEQLNESSRSRAPRQRHYGAQGPKREPQKHDVELAEQVALWKRSSEQMHGVCESRGVRYFHFLQPNQYFEGSKVLTEEERRVAYREDSPYRAPAAMGYPMLVEAGRQLVAAGVEFHDLSGLFEDVRETIYSDTCCHVNEQGNRMLAGAVGRAVAGAPGAAL